MDMKRFEWLLAYSGADLDSWPEDAATQAHALLAASPEARQLHQAMLWVDRALADSVPKVASPSVSRVVSGALDAIRQIPAQPSFMEQLRAMFAIPMPRLAFGMAAAAMGFAIGLIVAVPAPDRTAEEPGMMITTASANDVLF